MSLVSLPVPTRADARHRASFTEMLLSSLVSLLAAFVLSIDAVILAGDPDASFSCDINELISCSKVGLTWQANLLGFPNAFLGIFFEPIVITIAVAALGGVRFPRWFMNAAMGIYAIAIAFAYWLFTQAYFVIGALCPWCLVVTLATTLVFFSMLRINLLDNTMNLSERAHATVTRWLSRYVDAGIVAILFAVIAALIIVKYV